MPSWSDDEGRCHFDVDGEPCYLSSKGCPMHGGTANPKRRPRKTRPKQKRVFVCHECHVVGAGVDDDCCCTGCGCDLDAYEENSYLVGRGIFTRAEVEALLAAQREACAQELAVWLFESRAAQTVVRATPLVEVKP